MLTPKMQELYDAVAEFVQRKNAETIYPSLAVGSDGEWIHIEVEKDCPFFNIDSLSRILNSHDAYWFARFKGTRQMEVLAQI